MRAPLHPAWVWLPPFLCLCAIAAIVATGVNHALFLRLNHAGHVLGGQAWLYLTLLGDGAIALVLVLPWIRRAPRCFWAALAAAVFAGLWTQVTKQFLDVPRPLAVLGAAEFFHAGPGYRQVSFPSGHAAAASALAGIAVMGHVGRNALRALLLLVACLVGLSRIMIGVHWPVDVLWGVLGGWLGAWVGLALYGRRAWRTASTGGMLAGLVLLAMAATLLLSRHIGIPAALPLQRLIAGVCLLWGAWDIAPMLAEWRSQSNWRWRWWQWRRRGRPGGQAIMQGATVRRQESGAERSDERTSAPDSGAGTGVAKPGMRQGRADG